MEYVLPLTIENRAQERLIPEFMLILELVIEYIGTHDIFMKSDNIYLIYFI